ncbi:hypothetical protein QZH41_010138 [Actinostola sp. cb2023]|nr:hypothetical protein QZH41_010138 [Actinostola sp. cb2023]
MDNPVLLKTPPAFCFSIPLAHNIRACLQLTDVAFKPRHHGACLSLTLKALTFHKTFKLGCIYRTQRETGSFLRDWYQVRMVNVAAKLKWESKYGNSDWVEVLGNGKEQAKTMKHEVVEPALKCACTKPRKCMCCNTVWHNKTKVCGRILTSKKGKGIWLGLYVNNNKNFRVYTPVARRFTMVCGAPQINNVTASICLELNKIQQAHSTLEGCILAHVTFKTVHLHQDLGCFTLKYHKIDEHTKSDALIRFLAPNPHKFRIGFL